MENYLDFITSPLVINIAGYLGVVLFLILCGAHFYWTAGGKRGLHVTVPSIDNKFIFTPPAVVTFVIGFAFLLGAFVFLGRMGIISPLNPKPVYQWFPWFYAVIFLARAVGDFRFVGIFKKLKSTTFAYLDSILYIPVSLVLALCCSIIGLAPMA